MRHSIVAVLLLIVASLTGCATPTSTTVGGEPHGACDRAAISDEWLAPSAAIVLAGEGPDYCQPGAFALTVRSSGRSGSLQFFNSEQDYRDGRNLVIAVSPKAQAEIVARLNELKINSLEGQDLLVVGIARRVPIFRSSGRGYGWTYVSGTADLHDDVSSFISRIYYQTHVLVESASQVWLRPTVVARHEP